MPTWLTAFAAMWIMMHGWNASPSGASLAALGYAFGGPVLPTYCNVIFLVEAAATSGLAAWPFTQPIAGCNSVIAERSPGWRSS